MGTLMCIGLTTANSILVVTFANQRMKAGDDPFVAALAAGYTRLRPVLMTAGAMILGMIPMALGIGEGGEQNAPLGRAVIGGLLFATFATLILVPDRLSAVATPVAGGSTNGTICRARSIHSIENFRAEVSMLTSPPPPNDEKPQETFEYSRGTGRRMSFLALALAGVLVVGFFYVNTHRRYESTNWPPRQA